MALDQARWDTLRDHAGDNYAYDSRLPGEVAGGRPTSKARQPLRDWLATAQGGMCAVRVGNEPPHPIVAGEFNHVHAQGPGHKGYVGGNVFTGCKNCNVICADTYGERNPDGSVRNGGSIPLTALHADIISDTLPGITALLKSL